MDQSSSKKPAVFGQTERSRRRSFWTGPVRLSIVTATSILLHLALRYGFGGTQAVGTDTQAITLTKNFYEIKNFLQHPTPFSWVGILFCMTLPCILWIESNREYLTFAHKRLLWAAFAMAGISVIFGRAGAGPGKSNHHFFSDIMSNIW